MLREVDAGCAQPYARWPRDEGYVLFAARPLGFARGDKKRSRLALTKAAADRGDKSGAGHRVGGVPVKACPIRLSLRADSELVEGGYLRSVASQADGEDNASRRHDKRGHLASFQPHAWKSAQTPRRWALPFSLASGGGSVYHGRREGFVMRRFMLREARVAVWLFVDEVER